MNDWRVPGGGPGHASSLTSDVSQLSGPGTDDPLPAMRLRGTTAIARYSFRVGDADGPFVATVTLRDQSAQFKLAEVPPAG